MAGLIQVGVVLCVCSAVFATPFSSTVQLDGTGAFNLSWTLSDPSAAGKGSVQFTLTWTGNDWAAFGLHPKNTPDAGMPDAEVFMCNVDTTANSLTRQFCQVRNTLKGYVTPTVDPTQYIALVDMGVTNGVYSATFSRTVAKATDSPLSLDLGYNTTMGLIFARGQWSGSPMPGGQPLQHDGTAGRAAVNFYTAPAPIPPPPPLPPKKRAGLWPSRFDSNMTIAAGAIPYNGSLSVSVSARLRYSFPDRSQRWDYFKLGSNESVGGELWVGDMLYEYAANGRCIASNMSLEILRPDWLRNTTFDTTNFLLRQPPGSVDGTATVPFSNYTLADLYKIPNTIGMTNSWVVSDSPIAEPIRLEGPDDFDHPLFRSVLEFADFQPADSIDPSVFQIPASCHVAQGTSESVVADYGHPLIVSPARILNTWGNANIRR